MADVQRETEGKDADPLPEEEEPDPEEGGELEAGGEEDDVDGLASFLESEILSGSGAGDHLEQRQEGEEKEDVRMEGDAANNKRKQDSGSDGDGRDGGGSGNEGEQNKRVRREEKRRQAKGKAVAPQIDEGMFSNIPPELFLLIFKFLSSEDLISCALVCRFMNAAASDETLWRRLYCMRWGLASNAKLRERAWKNLYIQQDREDMVEFVRNTPTEFKEYYIQMQAAKRSQAPLPSEVNDDKVILDKTIADQVSSWKNSRGLTDEAVKGHSCSGNTCSYTQIGDAYICEKTGRVHVCDEACREFVLDQSSGLLLCTISGHCFERWLCPDDEWDTYDTDQQQGGVTDEAEPFMGSGRFARAYMLGYNCTDEKELEHALRFC
ncbi:F-box protein SKIP31-like isoform X2 [Phragmites australis]|uniref:F-box protein SKIP31-like isoform X2 n=1 Tax=Phragmites australis TaxID=29695 RepID=UPI002D77AE76|nr:F-box protein SKIP31-like isoform X2 [Phragmites australis]